MSESRLRENILIGIGAWVGFPLATYFIFKAYIDFNMGGKSFIDLLLAFLCASLPIVACAIDCILDGCFNSGDKR